MKLPGPDIVLKAIPGYEGLYAASSDGHIWSYPKTWISANGSEHHHDGRWLKADTSDEYLRVVLRKNGKPRRFSVHRLVATAWHSNPFDLPEVNHDDGNKRNNSYGNLEWCTKSFNEKHAWRTGLKRDTNQRRLTRQVTARAVNASRRKLTCKQADEVRERKAAGISWSALSREFHLARNALKAIVTGQSYNE